MASIYLVREAARNLEACFCMYVRDLMQRDVVTLSATESLGLADDIMRLGRIRHMPVTEGDRLIGILSQRDLFRAAISSVLQFRPGAEREWLSQIRVREVMTSPAVSISPAAPITEAVALLLEKRIGCLPVVEDGALVGLLSETDCLRHLAQLLGAVDSAPRAPGRR